MLLLITKLKILFKKKKKKKKEKKGANTNHLVRCSRPLEMVAMTTRFDVIVTSILDKWALALIT